MPLTRRAVLAALVVGVSGCAASPVISGGPAIAPSPPPPTRSPQDAAAHAQMARLRSLLTALGAVAGWDNPAWLSAAEAQCEAHEKLLALPDPLSADDQHPFPAETTAASAPATLEAAVEALDGQLAVTLTALTASAAVATQGDVRLLYTSAATATQALVNRSQLPGKGGPVPVRLQGGDVSAALRIALGHAWALIYGLGVGIGRLNAKDQLHALGLSRLAVAKSLRNDLRAAIGGDAPEQPAAFTLPNAMSTASEIRAAWAVLEGNLLDGYGRVVSASDDGAWRTAMIAQVGAIQAVGGSLGTWPGWSS